MRGLFRNGEPGFLWAKAGRPFRQVGTVEAVVRITTIVCLTIFILLECFSASVRAECVCTCINGRMAPLCTQVGDPPINCPATFCAVRPGVIDPIHPPTQSPFASCHYANVCNQNGVCKRQLVCR
jgi:hypothetical protein